MLDKKHEERLFQETISIFVSRFSKLSGAADIKSETDHTLSAWRFVDARINKYRIKMFFNKICKDSA